MRPFGAVELDDVSHGRADREARDEFVDRAFAAAGVLVVHIKAQRAYNTDEVARLIAPLLKGRRLGEQEMPPLRASGVDAAPSCPKCGIAMVLRTAKQGSNQGGQFWGCKNFPKCREIVAVASPVEA